MIVFFTRIPVKRKLDFSESEFIKGIKFIPAIGLLIGLMLYMTAKALGYMSADSTIISILVWTIYVILTGGLHLDGLADTVDGIYSNRSRERMLEIMKDSHIGTFGVLSIVVIAALNISTASYLDIRILPFVPVVGRTAMLFISCLNEYAREAGMGKLITENAKPVYAVIATAVLMAATHIVLGWAYIVPAVLSLAVTVFWVSRISGKLGGITGDVSGFSIEISQTIYLLLSYITIKLL